jgi:hypothetical protein
MSFLHNLAERRILEAIREGILDDLTLRGQPIPREDLSGVPEELRMGYKILNNAGYLPEELEVKKEILALQDLLGACTSPDEKQEAQRRLTLRRLQFDMMMEKRGSSLAIKEYQAKLEDKFSD